MTRFMQTLWILPFAIVLPGLEWRLQASEKQVNVFIPAGQSNMEGHRRVRSLDWLGRRPKYGHLLRKLKDTRDDVLPTKTLSDEYRRRGGHRYYHYSGSDAKGRFRVYNEDFFANKVLWDSGQMTADSPPKQIDIELKEVQCLMLVFDGKGATGDWADARVINESR